ncbi:MAG TPA: hypothetical protein VEW71_02670 [Allosphingosinicella sp.]|nr:hypothetical protein [Allosphingosinicella sp.]
MVVFTPEQWLILLLAFVLGLILGMAFLASPKWKGRYREEVRRREALETEIRQLRKDAAENDSLRQAAARDEVRHRDDEAGRRDEARLRDDEARLRDDEARRRDEAEQESLRQAAARDDARRRDNETGPV